MNTVFHWPVFSCVESMIIESTEFTILSLFSRMLVSENLFSHLFALVPILFSISYLTPIKLHKICVNMVFHWPVFSCIESMIIESTEFTILSLFSRVSVIENPFSHLFALVPIWVAISYFCLELFYTIWFLSFSNTYSFSG